MTDEVELIRDGEGFAVIGDEKVVERFLTSQGISSRNLDLGKLNTAMSHGAAGIKIGSEIAANSGRWIKLTKESAKALKNFPAMAGSQTGVARAIVTSNGKTKHILEFAKVGGFAANPAVLAGAAGIMSQMALQQSIDDISEYLEVIDAKVDDVLRAQKDGAISEMIGVELEIEEAMSLLDSVGWVSDVTWSKIQSSSTILKATQAYAIRQIDAIVEKVEKQRGLTDIADTVKTVEPEVWDWMAVLARCFQLQDAMGVLELDRVLTSTPEELDRHRVGLSHARQTRIDRITKATFSLIDRVNAVAGEANTKVLFQPFKPRAVVESGNRVTTGVADFHVALGIDERRAAVSTKRWRDAALEARDGAIDQGAEGFNAARRFGGTAVNRARSITADLAEQVAEHARVRTDESSAREPDVQETDRAGSSDTVDDQPQPYVSPAD